MLVGISVAGSVRASTIPFTYSTVSTGRSAGSASFLSVPGTYYFNNSFSGGTDGGTAISGSVSRTYPSGFGFYDDYEFTIVTAGIGAISSTISNSSSSQISNLQMRLFDASLNPTLPVPGTPVGTTTYAVSTTSNLGGGITVTYAVLPTTPLAAGTYVLEVLGSVTGSAGGQLFGRREFDAGAVARIVHAAVVGDPRLRLLGARRCAQRKPCEWIKTEKRVREGLPS